MTDRSDEDARLEAAHIAVAIGNHRKARRQQYLPVPPGLAWWEERFSAWSGRTKAEGPAVWPAAPLYAVDARTAAASLGISLRTVERLISEGELPSLSIGGARRIRTQDIEDYLRRQVAADAATRSNAASSRQDPPSRLSVAPSSDRDAHADHDKAPTVDRARGA